MDNALDPIAATAFRPQEPSLSGASRRGSARATFSACRLREFSAPITQRLAARRSAIFLTNWPELLSSYSTSASEVRRLAGEKLPATDFANELPIARRDFPAHSYDMGPAFNFESFKGVIIEIHLVGLGGDSAAVVRIVNHEISVAA